ncbi:hypothetical protein EX30DRAFT_337393 [Ascodesmis nigricans]|uniref:Dolichyl-diphosphooligosaccharide-protein glycosyltransferase subunit OST5 n=1 Tax=Ascodesmis nigricans TaxID=341454 RepID=A0A4S2N754_9PEZI|nr:hypothetical protein EX30DRAFT_337393 [Ascodesmis nigricans]
MEIEWESMSPFAPAVSKDLHAPVALVLMAIGFIFSGNFFLNKSPSALLVALPASAAFAFGAVFLMCAVGVYV